MNNALDRKLLLKVRNEHSDNTWAVIFFIG
jgi:hypothetical protein